MKSLSFFKFSTNISLAFSDTNTIFLNSFALTPSKNSTYFDLLLSNICIYSLCTHKQLFFEAVLATKDAGLEYVAYAHEKSYLFLYFILNIVCFIKLIPFLKMIALLSFGQYTHICIFLSILSKKIPSFFSRNNVISYLSVLAK